MAGNIVISQINGGPIGVINAIINGNFQVNQRGVSGTVTLAAGAYGHDRWKAGASGCTYTFATSNNVTTLTISSGSLIQVIEGINLYSDTYTLSWTGTAQGKIGAGSYAGSGVTGSVTGGTNLNIEFNTGTVSLVQFEPGVEASPFERRDYGRELMMCQRYYEQMNFTSGQDLCMAFANSGSLTQTLGVIPYTVVKRALPTVTSSAASTFKYNWLASGLTGTSFLALSANLTAGTMLLGLGSNAGQIAGYFGTTGSASFIAFSAEL